jgi:subtilisin family serine protease
VLDDDVVSDKLSLEGRRAGVAAIASRHAKAHRGTIDYIYETALKGYAIELPNEAAAIALSNSPRVKSVEEDGYAEFSQVPTSPQSNPPWGLDSIDGQMPAPVPNFTTGRTNGFYGWNSAGTGVTVYVLDSGINTGHEEFNTPFVSRASIAADCFTFVNCVGGQQTGFFNQQICLAGLPTPGNNDCYGHGTAVAAVIGGEQYGVAKDVTLKSVRVGSTNGAILSSTIAGVNWVTSQASPNIRAVASMTMELNPNTGVETAVQNSIGVGITYVVAAGNNNNDATINSPANVPDAITVGAVDWNGVRPTFSNWGPRVDLFAPGVSVVTALTGNSLCQWDGTNGASCIVSGTSFAAPHVAGAVAMYLSNKAGQTSCAANPITGVAPQSGNVSGCPDRVARFIKAVATMDKLTNINGGSTSANRFLRVSLIPGPANPIDNHHFFFWIQYMDFLNREPDNGGLQFYVDMVNLCSPSDAECIKAMRGAMSANFFRSPEFGGRGGYVANLFNIVFGQRPKTVAELSDPAKVERPHYQEFINDLATLTGTDAEVEPKKSTLANIWMGRPEVQAILPSSLSAEQFVQKLKTTAGVTTLANESTLINNLNNNTQTRAQVLRAVAESSEVTTKFQLQNFVTMQYIGHLRREPENCHGSPDPANCGYIFHYNRFAPGGDPHAIENAITRGFIESPEYRRRFGP